MKPDREEVSHGLNKCRCGELAHIYIKVVHIGRCGQDVYIAECQECGHTVPVVTDRFYAQEKITEAWNAQNPN